MCNTRLFLHRMLVMLVLVAVVTGMLVLVAYLVTGIWVPLSTTLFIFGLFLGLCLLLFAWLYWTEWRYED